MAQHFYNLGASPILNTANAAIQPVSVAGLKFRKLASADPGDFELSRIYDYRVGKHCLQENPREVFSATADKAYLCTDDDFLDFEALVRFRAARAANWGATSYFNGGGGLIFRWSGNPDGGGYLVAAGGAANGGDLTAASRAIRAYLAGVVSSNIQTTTSTYLPAYSADTRTRNFITMRLLVSGNNIKARAWLDTVTEPSTWGLDFNRTDFPLAGKIGIQLYSSIEGRVYDFLSIGTDGDPPPVSMPGGNRLVQGMLLRPDDTAAEGYVVRCYHRNSGVLLGEVLSGTGGAFAIEVPVPTTERVYCIAVDQLGNSWNAPIKDLITPATP